MKTKSLNYVLKRSNSRPRSVPHKANCVDIALMEGHGIKGLKAIWFRSGDGKKFGCKNDLYFQQSAGKMGYVTYKID